MRLAQHLTALLRVLVQAMSAWSVKTLRAPSQHCRGARVHSHTTMAMHDMGTPPIPSPQRCKGLCRFERSFPSPCTTCAETSTLQYLEYAHTISM